MRTKSELEQYYEISEKKWFILAFLCASSISFICTLVILDWQSLGWPLPAATASAILGTAFIYALFYEWYLLPPKATKLSAYYEKIIHTSVARSKFISIEALNRRVNNLIALLTSIVALSALSWIYPKSWYLTSLLISGFSGILAAYQIDEEINAPKKYRQAKITIFSLCVFVFLGCIGWLLSEFGPKFENQHFNIFLAYISAAFACGVLITFITKLPKIYRSYRDN